MANFIIIKVEVLFNYNQVLFLIQEGNSGLQCAREVDFKDSNPEHIPKSFLYVLLCKANSYILSFRDL